MLVVGYVVREHRADPDLLGGTGQPVEATVHVVDRRDATLDRLAVAGKRSPVRFLRAQRTDDRVPARLQVLPQGQVVAPTFSECGVVVEVNESRQHGLVGRIDHRRATLVGPRRDVGSRAHVGDAVAFDHHRPAEDHVIGVVHRDDGAVLDDDPVAHTDPLPYREIPCPDWGTADVRSTHTDFECRYGSSASSPSSLPNPECFLPPKGTATSNIPYVLIQTVPASSRSARRSALLTSDVQMPDASPYSTPLASASSSSSSFHGITERTGPKISSWATFMSLRTPLITVGCRKNPPSSPGTAASSPPTTTSAPCSRAAPTYPLTRARWFDEISGPIWVSGSRPDPRRSAPACSLSPATSSSATDASTNSREPATHACP